LILCGGALPPEPYWHASSQNMATRPNRLVILRFTHIQTSAPTAARHRHLIVLPARLLHEVSAVRRTAVGHAPEPVDRNDRLSGPAVRARRTWELRTSGRYGSERANRLVQVCHGSFSEAGSRLRN
jgi:hypothetical protein